VKNHTERNNSSGRMTVYEFITELERRIDYWKARGREEHHPVVVYAAPGPFLGEIPVRPKMIGRTPDGLRLYQFTMNQARRVVEAVRERAG